MLKIGEFVEKFHEWLVPSELYNWGKITVGKKLPAQFPQGRFKDGNYYIGNISFKATPSGGRPKPKLILDGKGNLCAES